LTACTNRTACVIDESGNYSRTFGLKRGTAQGDCPSPTLFIFLQQILLFKLELDPQVSSIFPGIQLPIFPVEQNNLKFAHESNRETNKTECFADDTSLTTVNDRANLSRVKNILMDFEKISGLKCNVEKTNLMPINGQVDEDTRALGFKIVDKVTLLGIEIDRDLAFFETVHDLTIQKVARISSFWQRFRLTLPGRIAVAKTLMFSQIGYIGSIITPTKAQLKRLEQIIFDFVKGPLNISNDKVTKPLKEGGVGLFSVDNYVAALQASWIKRAAQSARDNWRYDVLKITEGNPLTLHPKMVRRESNPIIFNLAESWQKFIANYYAIDENFWESYVFYNPFLQRGRNDSKMLDKQFFRQTQNIEMSVIAKTKVCDIATPAGLNSIDEITEGGVNLNLNTYMRLGESIQYFLNTKYKGLTLNGEGMEVKKFLNSWKKGSNKFRKVIERGSSLKTNMLSDNRVSTFNALLGIDRSPESLGAQYNIWGNQNIGNNVREFWYKFLTNSLPINTRVSHFADVSRACTFCELDKNNLPAMEETFRHLFFYCDKTSKILVEWENILISEFLPLSEDDRKKFWFTGGGTDPPYNSNIFMLWVRILVLYKIWEQKVQKTIKSKHRIKIEVLQDLKDLVKRDIRVKNSGLRLNIRFSADFFQNEQQR